MLGFPLYLELWVWLEKKAVVSSGTWFGLSPRWKKGGNKNFMASFRPWISHDWSGRLAMPSQSFEAFINVFTQYTHWFVRWVRSSLFEHPQRMLFTPRFETIHASNRQRQRWPSFSYTNFGTGTREKTSPRFLLPAVKVALILVITVNKCQPQAEFVAQKGTFRPARSTCSIRILAKASVQQPPFPQHWQKSHWPLPKPEP